MTDQGAGTETFAAAGDACTSCGAGLNPDQRYCLSCGARRAGAGLHFQQILASDAAAAAAVGAASAAAAPTASADRSSLPALASIACLLLALGVGVVIGNSGGSSATTAAPAAATAGTAAAAADTATTPSSAKVAAKKTATDNSASSAAASKASNPALKQLESLSPEQYQKQSLKLPKTVATGGKPPPKDNKAPAAGGSFETIG